MPTTQVAGTVFSSLDDEKILNSLDFSDFEEKFKLVGTGKVLPVKTKGSPSLSSKSIRSNGHPDVEQSLLEPKRIQNVAIARRKVSAPPEVLKQQIAG